MHEVVPWGAHDNHTPTHALIRMESPHCASNRPLQRVIPNPVCSAEKGSILGVSPHKFINQQPRIPSFADDPSKPREKPPPLLHHTPQQKTRIRTATRPPRPLQQPNARRQHGHTSRPARRTETRNPWALVIYRREPSKRCVKSGSFFCRLAISRFIASFPDTAPVC